MTDCLWGLSALLRDMASTGFSQSIASPPNWQKENADISADVVRLISTVCIIALIFSPTFANIGQTSPIFRSRPFFQLSHERTQAPTIAADACLPFLTVYIIPQFFVSFCLILSYFVSFVIVFLRLCNESRF